MRDWHVKHMQDTVVKYLTGLSENASRWQENWTKKYGNLTQGTKRIDYYLKRGVERHKVVDSRLRQTIGFESRFYSLETGFLNSPAKANDSLSFIDY